MDSCLCQRSVVGVAVRHYIFGFLENSHSFTLVSRDMESLKRLVVMLLIIRYWMLTCHLCETALQCSESSRNRRLCLCVTCCDSIFARWISECISSLRSPYKRRAVTSSRLLRFLGTTRSISNWNHAGGLLISRPKVFLPMEMVFKALTARLCLSLGPQAPRQ